MGNSYSDLHLYFHTKKTEKYKGTGYTVTVKQENYTGCSDFVVFTHAITFDPPNKGTNYNVLLYDGTDQKSEGTRVFGYYYPRNDSEIIKEVSTYYSVLAPNVPLVVSFNCGGNFYNCDFGTLKDARWDRSYNLTKYSFSNNLTKEDLFRRFAVTSRNRKIRFRIGYDHKEIWCNKQVFASKTYFRLIFIPKGNHSVIGSRYLYSVDYTLNEPKLPEKSVREPDYCKRSSDKDPGHKHYKTKINYNNLIDDYFFSPHNNQIYDGIMVYFCREGEKPKTLCEEHKDDNSIAMLVEFIDSCNSKKFLRRKDKHGYWWEEEPFTYNSDKELTERLSKIRKSVYWSEVNTIIIEKRNKYNSVNDFKAELGKKSYTKYTHIFKTRNEPILLFGMKRILTGQFITLKSLSKIVEVYYLKASGNEDIEPFLIVLVPDDKEKKNTKAYHFADKNNFEGWKEFNVETSETLEKKLEEKLEKIDKYCACLSNITTVRWYAHEILIRQEPDPPKPEVPPSPTRPPEVRPPDEPKPLPVWLIVGCVAAGVVLIVTSVVVYGIYWYNTTIKLLT